MQSTALLGLVVSIACLHLSDAGGYSQTLTQTSVSNSYRDTCWNYKQCQINTCPWTKRRYYAVMISQVKFNNFWGKGDSCGVFSQCSKSACGCVGMDVYTVKDRYIEGAWFSYDRSKKMQYLRRFSATLPDKSGYGEVSFFFSHHVQWVVPEHTAKKVTCDSCGQQHVETYTVPSKSVQTNLVALKVNTIIITVSDKFRILVFCSNLKGINDNKPFAVVLATMRQPGQSTWKEINKALRKNHFEPRSMVFLYHNRCINPPFEWCSKQVVQKNPQCSICRS